jgi:hypothetical protein
MASEERPSAAFVADPPVTTDARTAPRPRQSPRERGTGETELRQDEALDGAGSCSGVPASDVIRLASNVISVRHWDRLLGGLLYATSPRVDWARLLRRSLSIDVLECPKCHGRLRVLAVITEREPVARILARLGMPTEAPPLARARDPTDELDNDDVAGQLSLDLA